MGTPDEPSTSIAPSTAAQLRRLPHNIWVVSLTSFLTDVSSEMLFNLLPLFLSSVLGVRTGVIGLIEGVAEATASLVNVGSGWLSDRLKMRKRLAVFGYALSTLAKPFLAGANRWGVVLGVRFADRFGKGLRTAPRDALVADSVDARRRGLAFGLHRASDTAGAVVGLGIAIWVLHATQRGLTSLTRGAFQTVVFFSLIPAAAAVFVLAVGAREVQPDARKPTIADSEEERGGGATRRGVHRAFAFFIVIVVIFTLGNSSNAFLILRAKSVGIPVIGVMAMMLVFNVVYALASTPAGVLSDRWGRRKVLMSGWTLYAVVYAGLALVGAAWQMWLCMAFYGLYHGMTEGAARAYVADLIASERRGAAYGFYGAAVGLAAFPASAIAGALWQGIGSWSGWGPSAPFWYGAVMALTAAVLLALFPRLVEGSFS
jgi:MFS family permease